jgi:hypothetical protein
MRAYRERKAAGEPGVRYRKPEAWRTRQRRWRDAVQELFDIQADCQVWRRTHNAADVTRLLIAGFRSVCPSPPRWQPSLPSRQTAFAQP